MSEITQAQKTALLKLPGFKDIQKQYAVEAKQAGSGKRRMRMRGGGFWDDVGNWFVQAGKDINQFLKDTKIVSNIAAYALPILGAMGGALLTANPLGATAGGIAGKSTADYIRSQGYGYVNKLSTIGTKKIKGMGHTKVMGMGKIFAQNGMLVNQPKQSGGRMKANMMGGATTQFNVVSNPPAMVAF
jgi:hypothetical protein